MRLGNLSEQKHDLLGSEDVLTMNLEEYRQKAMRTQANQEEMLHRLYFKLKGPGLQLINGVIGLMDEVGEISSCIKKHVEYQQELDVVNLKEEVGDCLWRLAQICDAVGLNLEECAESNILKLLKRYPEKYSDHLAAEVNRDRAAERLTLEQEPFLTSKLGGSEEVAPNRAIRVGQGISQTGVGWAEPPEEVVLSEVPVLVAHFGDGLVREPRDSSYSGFCSGCNKPIHYTNTAGLCPDCGADKRAGRTLHNEGK